MRHGRGVGRPRKAPRRSAASREKPRRAPRPAGPAPAEAALREAALAHRPASPRPRSGLKRVLQRKVDRWAGGPRPRVPCRGRRPEAAAPRRGRRGGEAMVAAGRWTMPPSPPPAPAGWPAAGGRAGRSRRISAPRAWRAEPAAAALPGAETEAGRGAGQCRRRRIGPSPGSAAGGPAARARCAMKRLRRWPGRLRPGGRRGGAGHGPSEAEERLIAAQAGVEGR